MYAFKAVSETMRVVIGLMAATVVACGPSPASGPSACTSCPTIEGMYIETATEVRTPECPTGMGTDTVSLHWKGESYPILVEQGGAMVSRTDNTHMGEDATGTLQDDNTIVFSTNHGDWTFSDGTAPGQWYLNGTFAPGQAVVFSGQYNFSMDGTSCGGTSAVTWGALDASDGG